MPTHPIVVTDYAAPSSSRGTNVGRASFSAWVGAHSAEAFIKACSFGTLIGLWFIAAATLPSSVIPGPLVVVDVLRSEVVAGAIWIDVAVTMRRILLSFSLAMSVAFVLGFAMGLSKTVERFFDVWLICGISLPSLVTILTIFMVLGLNETAAVFAAAIPIIPILTINIWGGIKGVDQKLIDMAKAYHAGRWRIVRSVVAPQIAPVIVASARFGLGLIWKMVLCNCSRSA
jgi:NitT/TauT family transport system permease protein